jgi:hypothetical protein
MGGGGAQDSTGAAGVWCSRGRGTGAGETETEAEKAMDALTVFGLFSVTAMLVCYALEDRSAWFILGFAVACVLGSVYGFLQGA